MRFTLCSASMSYGDKETLLQAREESTWNLLEVPISATWGVGLLTPLSSSPITWTSLCAPRSPLSYSSTTCVELDGAGMLLVLQLNVNM